MFDRLVVSTTQKRKGRTTAFFICTSIVYLSTIAVAFAVSVLIADPKIADTTEGIIHIAGLPPAPRGPDAPVIKPNPGGTPRQDLTHVLNYDDIANRPHNGPPQLPIPAGTRFTSGEGPAGGRLDGVPGVIGVPGSDSSGVEPPPHPVDPPKPQPPAANIQKPLPLASTVLQGKAIDRVRPAYPVLAKQIHLQGDVSVEVIISPEGRVESARVVSGHPMFAQVARNAAMSWRFQPTILNGVPVRVTGVIVFVFKLGE